MARLIVKSKGEQPDRVIELKPGVNRLGRGEENDVKLPFPEISDQHCELLVDNEFVFVRDLNSSNGTYIDGDVIHESALYSGQALQIGPLELVLDAPQIHISLPELPKPEPIGPPPIEELADGYASCMGHPRRHAIWECPHCTRVYCDECIRKLRRVGGIHLRLCPSCSHPCQLTTWAEMMRKKKKSFFSAVVSKISSISSTLKRTTASLKHPPTPPASTPPEPRA